MNFKLNSSVFSYLTLPLKPEIFCPGKKYLKDFPKVPSLKRQHEFIAGRLCAQNCLKKLNCPENVRRDFKTRRPIWPSGIAGSISHNDTYAIALASRKAHALGVDIERVMSDERSAKLLPSICTQNESTRFTLSPQIVTLIFSAKESLFKAVHPLVQVFFGFHEASLIKFGTNEFEILLHSNRKELKAYNLSYKGRYFWLDEHIITYLELLDDDFSSFKRLKA